MNEPKLRFPEFTDDWKSCKVSEVAEKTFGGGTPKTSNETFWIGDIPWIQSSDLVDGNLFDINPKKYISQEAINKSAAKLVPENSIAVVTRVGVGKLMFIPFSYATSQDFLSLSGLKTEPQFTSYSLYKRLQQDLCKVQGTSIKGITKDELLVKEIMVPSYEEQKKIGECLHSVDTLIQSAEKELEGYRELKQGMLQKMFPKKGEKVPEIRFPEFTGDWEQCKLGDIGKTYTSLSGKTADDFGHGEANFITYMNVYSNSIADPTMVAPIEIDAKQHEVEVGDVFFTTSSETPDEVGMSCVLKEKQGIVYLNSFCFGFRPTKSFDLNFLAYMLRSNYVRNQIKILAQGVSRYNISKTKMMDVSIIFPDYEEQKKIGEYFQNLDNLIASQQQELDGYKELKKGLLQQMFC